MAEAVPLDTDVLLKVAAYRLALVMVAVVKTKGNPAALGLTHLIAAKQLSRRRNIRDRDGALAELQILLAQLGSLEPNEAEILLAAELTARAQDRGLPLDTGEAQLAAITIVRSLPMFVTGDKRALSALANLIDDETGRLKLQGRLVCFEQVLVSIAARVGPEELRRRVCVEPDVDGAMRLAFSCARDEWDPSQLAEACNSYIGAIRADVGSLLAPDSMLA